MSISRRKNDHIRLAKISQVNRESADNRFYYEPLLSPLSVKSDNYSFLKHSIGGPIFLSSITGGSREGKKINRIIGKAAKELKLPMGLGSIRAYIEGSNRDSFKIRSITGYDTPLFGNLGIAQLETFFNNRTITKINESIKELELNGLIIHINPLHEWVQPEGDRYNFTPLDLLNRVLPELESTIIIKEVGCGFGPKSLKELMKMPIDVIDFGSFGGTNFTKLELLRSDKNKMRTLQPLINIGNTPDQMINNINPLLKDGIGLDKEYIISGGIKNFLDGYYYNSILDGKSIYGYAGKLLKYAKTSAKSLIDHLEMEIESYAFCNSFLHIKDK